MFNNEFSFIRVKLVQPLIRETVQSLITEGVEGGAVRVGGAKGSPPSGDYKVKKKNNNNNMKQNVS